jgi:GTP cyclohydrolase IA
MTAQIADAIAVALEAKGVAVMVEAEHQCVTTRGVGHAGVTAVTTRFLGAFESDPNLRQRFMGLVEAPRRGR